MIGKEDKVGGMGVKYNGTFNLDKLYKDAKNWFRNYKYDFTEKEYKEKKQAHGDEIIIEFIGEKDVDDYARFSISVSIFITGVKKLSKDVYIGDFRANLKVSLNLDYNNEWQYNKLKEFLFFIYNNFIIKNKIENYEGKLYGEFIEYESLIKKILGLR